MVVAVIWFVAIATSSLCVLAQHKHTQTHCRKFTRIEHPMGDVAEWDVNIVVVKRWSAWQLRTCCTYWASCMQIFIFLTHLVGLSLSAIFPVSQTLIMAQTCCKLSYLNDYHLVTKNFISLLYNNIPTLRYRAICFTQFVYNIHPVKETLESEV